MNDNFPDDVALDIVSHMNEDHADALLAIARVHAEVPEATTSRMLAITPEWFDMEIDVAGTTRNRRVTFEPPIAPLDTVRARLVSLTKSARAALRPAIN